MDRQGIELAVEGLSSYVASLNQAADATELLVVRSTTGAQRTAEQQTAMLNTIQQSATRVAELNLQAAGVVDQFGQTIRLTSRTSGEAVNNLVIVQERASSTITQSYDKEAVAARIAAQQEVEAAKQVEAAIARTVAAREKAANQVRDLQGKFLAPDVLLSQQALDAQQTRSSLGSSVNVGGLSQRLASGVGNRGIDTEADARMAAVADRYSTSIKAQAKAAEEAAASHGTKTSAIRNQATAEESGASTGLRFVSVLGAIHAANSLVANSTFSTVGSVLTLGYAFSAMGPAGAAAGVGFGIVLRSIEILTNAFQQIVSITEAVGESLLKIGAVAAAAFAAVTVAGVKGAADIQQNLTLVQGITGATGDTISALRDKVLEVSNTFGVSGQEISNAAALYVKAGGTVEGAMNGALQAIAQLKVIAPNLGTEEASNAIISMANNFKVSAQEAADAIVSLSKTSTLSFNGIVQAIRQIGPEAGNLRIPLSDITALIAELAQRGIAGTTAGTQLKQMLIDLVRPGAAAREELQRVNISLVDQQGNIRPTVDLIADLQRAYGAEAKVVAETSDITRAHGLAVVFGSRALIAANVIADDGTKRFRELKEQMQGITAEELSGLLLQTTNRQLEILKTNATNAAIAFGGPLNIAIGRVTQQVNDLVSSVQKTGVFQALGNELVSLLSGQGLNGATNALTSIFDNDQITNAIKGIVGTLATVRSAIVDDVVPAFEHMGAVIVAIASNADFTSFFSKLAGSAQAAIEIIAEVINAIADFVEKVAAGGPEATNLKNVITGLATAVGTTLVGAFVTTVAPMILVIDLLSAVGKAVLDNLDKLNTFNSAWDLGWKIAADSVGNFVQSINPKLAAVGAVIASIGQAAATGDYTKVEQAIDKLNQVYHADFLAGTLGKQPALDQINQQLANTQTSLAAVRAEAARVYDEYQSLQQTSGQQLGDNSPQQQSLKALQVEAGRLVEQERNLIIQQQTLSGQDFSEGARVALAKLAEDIEKIRNADPIDFDAIFGDAKQQSDALINGITGIIARIHNLTTQNEEGGTTAGFFPDPKKVQEQANAIQNIITSSQDRLVTIEQQQSDRETDIVRSASDRQLEIEENLITRRTELEDQKNINLEKLDRDFTQAQQEKQEDRTLQRNLQRYQEDWQQYFQALDFARNQDDQKQEQTNQRQRQDKERLYGVLEQLAETDYQNSVAKADQLYARTQQIDSTRFSRSQQDQETAFQRNLDTQARSRDRAQQLLAAKTPEDRTKLTTQFTQEDQNIVFQQQQQEKLTKFRRTQEDQATTFRNTQEDQSFNRRIQQHLAEFNYRLSLETLRVKFTRGLDDDEFAYRQGINLRNFGDSVTRTNQLRDVANTVQGIQNNAQDAREQQRYEQRRSDINTEADLQDQKLVTNYNQAQTTLDAQVTRQRLQSVEQIGKQELELRNSVLLRIQENEQKYGPSPVLNALKDQINTETQPAIDRMIQAQQQLNSAGYTPGTQLAVPGVTPTLSVPRQFDPNGVFGNLPRPDVSGLPAPLRNLLNIAGNNPQQPNNVLTQATAGLTQFLASPSYRQQVAQGVADGLNSIIEKGPLPVRPTTAPVITPGSTSGGNPITDTIRAFRG